MGGDGSPSSIFISYSRADAPKIISVIRTHPVLDRAAFIDFRDTPPGKQWQADHNSRIRKASRLVLCWSKNASQSKWVDYEWRLARSVGTAIIPVLLDDTPLPHGLDGLNAVDVRDFTGHSHHPPSPVSPNLLHGALALSGLGATLVIYALFQSTEYGFTIGRVLQAAFGLLGVAWGLSVRRKWATWHELLSVVDRAVIHDLQEGYKNAEATVPIERLPPDSSTFRPALDSLLTKEQIDIKRRFLMMLQEKLSVVEEAIYEDSDIRSDLGADSIEYVELLIECSEAFGVQVPPNGAPEPKTVGDTLRYILFHKTTSQ